MMKRTLMVLLAVFVLAAAVPALAEDSSPTVSNPPLLSAQSSLCPRLSGGATATPELPQLLMPQPEAKVILCGWCSESSCVYKNVRANCRTSDGSFGTCTTLSPPVACSGEIHTECYCGQFP